MKLGRFGMNQAKSARIQEKKRKEKKNLRRGTDTRAIASDAASRIKPRRTRVRHPPNRVHAL